MVIIIKAGNKKTMKKRSTIPFVSLTAASTLRMVSVIDKTLCTKMDMDILRVGL